MQALSLQACCANAGLELSAAGFLPSSFFSMWGGSISTLSLTGETCWSRQMPKGKVTACVGCGWWSLSSRKCLWRSGSCVLHEGCGELGWEGRLSSGPELQQPGHTQNHPGHDGRAWPSSEGTNPAGPGQVGALWSNQTSLGGLNANHHLHVLSDG